MFRRTIPEEARYDTRFVFRQVWSQGCASRSSLHDPCTCSSSCQRTCMWQMTRYSALTSGAGSSSSQGSPLIPDDLRMVAASKAAVICVISDTSRHVSSLTDNQRRRAPASAGFQSASARPDGDSHHSQLYQ